MPRNVQNTTKYQGNNRKLKLWKCWSPARDHVFVLEMAATTRQPIGEKQRSNSWVIWQVNEARCLACLSWLVHDLVRLNKQWQSLASDTDDFRGRETVTTCSRRHQQVVRGWRHIVWNLNQSPKQKLSQINYTQLSSIHTWYSAKDYMYVRWFRRRYYRPTGADFIIYQHAILLPILS